MALGIYSASGFEIAARWKKAIVFASHLYANGIVSSEIYKLSKGEWRTLADRLLKTEPSMQTIATIEEILTVLEAAVAQKIAEEKEQQTA